MIPRARKVAFIGFGSIGSAAARHLAADEELQSRWRLAGVLTRTGAVPGELRAYGSLAELLDDSPDLVVECAGHEALRTHAERVLSCGIDLAALSIGALADDAFRGRLAEACARSGSKLQLLPGAVAGIEGLAAMAIAGLESVTYESVKPPAAWRGTPAEKRVDLGSLNGPATFFEGTARAAATEYPKNANVAATVALAGAGLDSTRVRLTADPQARGNRHVVVAHGALGTWRLEIESAAAGTNARTSAVVPLSIIRLLRNGEGSIAL